MCHSSLRSSDPLIDFVNKCGTGSVLSDRKVKRTKCADLIKNVIGLSIKQDLIEEFFGIFSIVFDKSTDIAVQENLCILVRYFSDKFEKVVTKFVGLFPVQ